ncbi:MAG TPA: RNA polymerase sigma factor [Puia sp.]|jgi:RNA polymerase sigma factor (sigma-70 family)|nr:RNA polymerase sigma factor [Puia sp.]
MSVFNSSREADRRIIALILQGGLDKRKGEEALFGGYAYFVQEGIRKHGLTEEHAFNAYSDSVLVTIDNISLGTFQGNSSLKTYLYRIFRNKCVDLLRKNATNKNSMNRALSIDEQLSQVSDRSRSILQVLIDKADWKLLKERLNQLSDDCRKMLLLWADSFSDKEIAVAMEYKTADVVKTSRLRCLEKLRRLYHTV